MARHSAVSLTAALAGLASLLVAAPAGVDAGVDGNVKPPWCGVPENDAAGNLPDGTQPGQPAGSFAHIPYYAIRCTLEEIVASSNGRMSLEVIGQSALGRDLFLVTVNALDTVQQRQDFHNWQQVRSVALTDPARGQQLLQSYGDRVKVPVFVQGAIHGNEFEGVEAIFETLYKLANTPYGADPEVDAVLDHSVVLFNVIQNPDGRIAGARANGNGFDLNRDFMTQSQSETRASVAVMQKWLPPEVLDLHGYVTPTLIEATTKPHNPSIDYDLWLKWNQPRIDANEAALAASNFAVTRPVNDWCSDGEPAPPSGICPDGQPPGPAVAEGWDDWGPFYTPMYAQHIGLNGSTVEMCNQANNTNCALPGTTPLAPGRLGSRIIQEIVVWSTLQFDIANRNELLHDELERYLRGVTNAPRPPCCEPPFDVDNNWMEEFPTAYIVPMGSDQRSEPEANRLVDWLLANGILVEEMKQAYTWDGATYPTGSYVVYMDQAHRGLADTALGLGADISQDISILYAPPAAWSHGYLWGADVVRVPREAAFNPSTNRILKASHLLGGVEPGPTSAYALEIDSPTAVRTLNALMAEGTTAELALAPSTAASGAVLPTGSAIFAADPATKVRLASIGRANDVWFQRVGTSKPPTEPIDRMPRVLVLTGTLNQDVWSLQNLGFTPQFMSTVQLNAAAEDPLPGYDVIWNTGGWPGAGQPTARQRLTAFFQAGGGYIGAGAGGASFLTNGGLVSGLTAATRGGSGRSGIVNWDNVGGAGSPITGATPARDTAIMDPPTWFTSIPATMSVDGRFPTNPDEILASGMWLLDAQSASAPGSAVIVHGTTTAGTARATVFAMNPLYRADPEREWSMAGLAAYWADQ
jgi:hypothetical protein